MTRRYSELIQLKTFEERFAYLKLDGRVGVDTFGFDRWMNQRLYRSEEWKRARSKVGIRDNGCDLAMEGYEIVGKIFVHHMNPLKVEDLNDPEKLLNPEYLICVSFDTHNAIHYGTDRKIAKELIERRPGDTCPWR